MKRLSHLSYRDVTTLKVLFNTQLSFDAENNICVDSTSGI